MPSRREVLGGSAAVALLLATSGLRPARAQGRGAFGARTLGQALDALGFGTPAESDRVVLHAPEIAENAAAVRIGATVEARDLHRLVLFVAANPNPLAAVFDLTGAVEPTLRITLRLAQTSDVYAVALLADDRVLYARRQVAVVLDGCA